MLGSGRRQQYMSSPTAAAPYVRGYPPGVKGHGNAVCYVVASLEVEAVHCVVYDEWSVRALAFHSQCGCSY